MTRTPTLKVTLRTGEVFTYIPDDDMIIRYEVEREALVLRKRATKDTQTSFTTIRIFAAGVWRDIEAL